MRKQPSPRRYTRSLLLTSAAVGIGLVGCCGGLAAFGDRPTSGVHVEHLEADLVARLPYGSTREQADAWFQSHGIRYGTVTDTAKHQFGLSAMVPIDGILDRATIWVHLQFGPDGRLTQRKIHRRVYSL